MKYLKLFERKQLGTLYHKTSDLNNLESILETNILFSLGYNYVSFTRNFNLKVYSCWVQLVINGDSLSDKYRVEPFQFMPDDPDYGDECEERIVFPTTYFKDNNCCVKTIKKYIRQIHILQSGFDKAMAKYWEEIDLEIGQGEYFRPDVVLARLQAKHPELHFVMVKKFGRGN